MSNITFTETFKERGMDENPMRGADEDERGGAAPYGEDPAHGEEPRVQDAPARPPQERRCVEPAREGLLRLRRGPEALANAHHEDAVKGRFRSDPAHRKGARTAVGQAGRETPQGARAYCATNRSLRNSTTRLRAS